MRKWKNHSPWWNNDNNDKSRLQTTGGPPKRPTTYRGNGNCRAKSVHDLMWTCMMSTCSTYTSQSVIDELHKDGRVVVCYFSAGTYESWRADWAEFFDFIQSGVNYEGDELPFAGKMADWDERWLDIRQIDLLAPIMKSRLALAASKKCDAVEPDNMDAFTNEGETGIPITYEEQLAYNKFIATEAHAVGLSVGLKNDLDQLEDLVDDYDWALNEQCFEYEECDRYKVFKDQNKAVFGVEYKGWICRFCAEARAEDLSWLKKKYRLGAYRQGCDDLLTRMICWLPFLLA